MFANMISGYFVPCVRRCVAANHLCRHAA